MTKHFTSVAVLQLAEVQVRHDALVGGDGLPLGKDGQVDHAVPPRRGWAAAVTIMVAHLTPMVETPSGFVSLATLTKRESA